MREPLTPREQQAANLAAQGMSNRDIAESLTLKPGTVEQYLHSVYDKLGVGSRMQLLRCGFPQVTTKEP